MNAVGLLGFTVLLVGAAVPARAQIATFSAKVEAVRVDVLVTRDGTLVSGLLARDFTLLDNGVAQEVSLVSSEQIPLNVILVLDMSASVTGERLAQLRDASLALVDALRRQDKAACLTFNHAVTQASGLTADLSRVRAAIARSVPQGQTSLIDATFEAMMVGESDEGRSVVIAFSDGLDVSSWLVPNDVLDIARRSEVVVYGVSVARAGQAEFSEDG
jgi:Ca-activated chloride channel family protein